MSVVGNVSENVIKLLLVEDNYALARLMQTMLGRVRSHQFQCQLSGSMAEVAMLIPKGQFDVVLLDLELPDSQGLSSLEKVANLRPDLPVVVLTAREEEDMATKALRQGAQDYLIKGTVDRRQLVRALVYAIERRRAEAEHDSLRRQLELARSENQVLRSLLPLCARCKRLRDDEAFRRQVEVYLAEHSGQGLCPDCAKLGQAA